MKRAFEVLLALVSLGLFLGGVGWVLRLSYERGADEGAGSTFRSDPRGLRALYLLFERTGNHPIRLRTPVPPRGAGLLLCIEPFASAEERDQDLLDWVRGGGTIVLTPAEVGPSGKQRTQDAPLAVLAGLRLRAKPRHGPVWDRWPPAAQRVLEGDGGPSLVTFPLGRGTVWALAEPERFENARINEERNLDLALQALGGAQGPLYFDEYRHGHGESRGLAYVLLRYNLLPTAFSFLGLLGLLAWRTTPPEAGRATDEWIPATVRDSLVEARAGLYTRTLSPRDALKLLERDFRHELSRRLRSPRLLPLRETQRLLGERAPAHAPALKAALGELAILKAQPPGRLDDLVPFSRRLAELLEEIR